jgi:hypothetical protein
MKRTSIKKSIFTLLATVFCVANAFAQMITDVKVTPGPVCSGSAISIAFTATSFPAGTTYTVQVSNATGSFEAPLETATGSSSPISVSIPASATSGDGYKAKVLVITPANAGAESAAFTIKSTPPTPTSGNYPSYCVGETPGSLPVATTPGTTFTWYAPDGTPQLDTPTINTSVAQMGTNYVYSQTVNGCESGKDTVTIYVYDVTRKPSVTTPAPICQYSEVTVSILRNAVSANSSGTSLMWYESETGKGYSAIPTPSTAVAGTKDYFVTALEGTRCPSPKVKVTVTVKEAPAKPVPVSALISYALNAVTTVIPDPAGVSGATFKWYEVESAGSPLPAAPKPSTSVIGTKKYWVSQTVNGCESERAEIAVNVSAAACTPPDAPKVVDKSYNIGDTPVSLALSVTGTNLLWYEAKTGGTGSVTPPTISTASVITKSYWVTQSATPGSCESERAEIVVTVSAAACVAPAAPKVVNKNYTVGESPVSLALSVTGTNLLWYDTKTGGTGSASPPTISTASVSTKSYWVTQSAKPGSCESERAEIVVSVGCGTIAKPTVSTIDPVCLGTILPSSLISSAVSPKTNLIWYDAASGGTGSATIPPISTQSAGVKNVYVTQTLKGCESERAVVSIEVKALPQQPTVTAIDYCKDVTNAVALTASGSNLKWYAAATGGNALGGAPKPSTTTVGTTSYFVSQTTTTAGLTCESPRAELKVTINALPAALPTLSEAICQEREDKTYTFPTQASEGNTINWYTAATGGAASQTRPSVNLKNAGETTFFATQVSEKKCESTARVAQKIRVKPLPGLPTIASPTVEICQFVAAPALTATPVKDGILKWYGTNATGGDPSDAAPVPSTAEGGTTSYYVGQALEGCFSDRAKIDVKINTTPKPQTTTALAYCQNAVAPRLDATGSILKWYRNATDTEFQGIPFTPFTEKVQDYSFYVTQTGANGCESPKEEIKIHIKALPSATISGNSTIDLGETAAIKIRFTGDGPWMYALSNGMTDTTDQADHEITVKPTTTTTYLLTEVANACGKGTPIGSALVTVKVPTINSGNPSVAEACAGKTFNVPFQQSGDFPAENTFKVQIATVNADANFKSIPSVATSSSVTATFPDTTLAGSYFVRVISSGTNPAFTVKGSVSSITITASPLPVATISGTQTILVGDKADMKIETTGKAPWTFTLNNGTKDSLITASVTPYTFKLAPRVTTTYTISKVTNGCGTGKGAGSARVQVDPILGVEPPALADWVKVYPTLVTSQLTIEITNAIAPKAANAEIIDMNGRSRSIKNINQKTTEVDFSGYASGLYLLRVKNGNKNTVVRILKP